jgi:hypothetical protein
MKACTVIRKDYLTASTLGRSDCNAIHNLTLTVQKTKTSTMEVTLRKILLF